LDLLDVVSIELHLGLIGPITREGGIYANIHATRAIQAGGGFRRIEGFGWHDQRSLGMQFEEEANLNLLCFSASHYSGQRLGTSGYRTGFQKILGVCDPKLPVYQEFSDYWSVGGSLTLVAIGVSADIHPVEIADFLSGFIGVDVGNDDVALTKDLNLNNYDRELLHELSHIYFAGNKR
jgi:hypothetical protein